MGDGLKKEIIDLDLKIKHPADRDLAFVANTDKGAYSLFNLSCSVLSERGFHIRFESEATDLEGRTLKDHTAVYIDDPEEKKKHQQIHDLLRSNGLYRLYWRAEGGTLTDEDLDEIDELSDEEKKALMVFSLMESREINTRLGFAKEVEEKGEQIEELGVPPYSLQLMRERIAGIVDGILKAHPELVPDQPE